VSEFHAEEPQATVSEGRSQSPYMAARAVSSLMIRPAVHHFAISNFLLMTHELFLSHKLYEILFTLMNFERILVNDWFTYYNSSLDVSKTNYLISFT